MSENDSPTREEPVCTLWQRMLEGVLGVCLLVGVTAMVRYYPSARPDGLQQNDPQKTELERQVQQLGHEVQQLQREQAMGIPFVTSSASITSDTPAISPSSAPVFPAPAS
jgi:hypothetical protein